MKLPGGMRIALAVLGALGLAPHGEAQEGAGAQLAPFAGLLLSLTT